MAQGEASLPFGVDADGALVSVEQVGRGVCGLVCPYCGGPLLAKKGHILAPHFAHAGATCLSVQNRQSVFTLPAYDRFDLSLPPSVLQKLKQGNWAPLEGGGLVEWNSHAGRYGDYVLTRKGKIVLGELSTPLFAAWQAALWQEKHEALAKAAHTADAVDKAAYETDLRLFLAQWRRAVSLSLYFLRVEGEGETVHKIGVTRRAVEERVEEVKRDVKPHLGDVAVHILGVWPHRGAVEPYCLYRFGGEQRKLGAHREYFAFEDAPFVLRELRRLKAATLTQFEKRLLEEKEL